MAETNLFYQQLEEQCGPDYVKVIRCKDCREYDTTGYDTPEFGYCKCLKQTVQDCFYCAYGEKWIQEELQRLQKQIDELRWKYETKTATKVNADV